VKNWGPQSLKLAIIAFASLGKLTKNILEIHDGEKTRDAKKNRVTIKQALFGRHFIGLVTACKEAEMHPNSAIGSEIPFVVPVEKYIAEKLHQSKRYKADQKKPSKCYRGWIVNI
jgi:hypothetical protein